MNKISAKKIIGILAFFIVVLLIGFYFENKRKNLLNTNMKIEALVISKDDFLGPGAGAMIEFEVNNKKINSFIKCDCHDIEVGDTVLIKYAVEDPELTVIVDKYYMQKYRHLKGK